jgi:mono/diheme cytochrome c family protein
MIKATRKSHWIALLPLAVVSLGLPPQSARAAASGKVGFSRDILPILSENCFACHGPDDDRRKAHLRFDRKEVPFKPAKSGQVPVVPGDVSKSEMIARITAQDEDDRMPPVKSGKTLTPVQIDLIRRWIAEGAPWGQHWAFETPKRPALPDIKNKSWPRNEIDYFVAEKLEEEGLKPSPEAGKTTLIRRATLDLTGLPPTIEEVDAFLADSRPQAYDELVDRLLNSPRYGENMTRYWLDAARYADSHGYHIDSERSIWKYRGWVIDAFNENKPFDQFTVEQLAGDLLPHPTTEQKIGSGYVRCNMSTGEGGAIVDEYQAKYGFDRVETTGTIWLGLTLVCCRCHNHKYDPIQQKEYYRLFAFFNNLDESVMDGNRPNPDPFIRVPSPEQTARLGELKKWIEDGQKKLDAPMPDLDEAQVAWEKKWRQKLSQGWTVVTPAGFRADGGAQFKTLEDQSVLVDGPNPPKDVYNLTLKLPPGPLAALRLEALPHVSLPKKSSARAEDGSFRLSEIEAELVSLKKDGQPGEPRKLKFSRAVADQSREGQDVARAIDGKADTGWQPGAGPLTEAHLALFILDQPQTVEQDTELRVRLRYEASEHNRAIGHFRLAAACNDDLVGVLVPPRVGSWQVLGPFKSESLKQGFETAFGPEEKVDLKQAYPGVREEIKWHENAAFKDGKKHLLVDDLHGVHGVYYLYRTVTVANDRRVELSLRADDLFKLWLNGNLALERDAVAGQKEGTAKVTVDLKKGENKLLVKVVNLQGACYFDFDQDLDESDTVPADVAPLFAAAKTLSADEEKKVRTYFRRVKSPAFKQLHDEVAQWREETEAINQAIPTTLVAKERDKRRVTHLLMRGQYDKPGEEVTPGVPAVLTPFPKDAPTNRLGLALWLVDPSNPLTARVNVNRFWQQYFGIGLVKTVEDFGVQGEQPSHPKLLDWLATEFIRSGWDVKHIQKLIVTSATYRQTSHASPDLIARDPENRLLARGARFRVDGEVLRDMALYVGGLLVDKEGGHSVKPYEPPGLWEAVSYNNSQKYVPDKGEGQFRRSLYTYWKRQSPPPNMLLFDAPTREYCVVRRPRTNTPLQALAMLNDPQFVESSRGLGERMMREGGPDPRNRVVFAFRLATARVPAEDEIKVLLDVYQEQVKAFRQDPESAEKLLGVGTVKACQEFDHSELAAWTTVASMILNLDETITKG